MKEWVSWLKRGDSHKWAGAPRARAHHFPPPYLLLFTDSKAAAETHTEWESEEKVKSRKGNSISTSLPSRANFQMACVEASGLYLVMYSVNKINILLSVCPEHSFINCRDKHTCYILCIEIEIVAEMKFQNSWILEKASFGQKWIHVFVWWFSCHFKVVGCINGFECSQQTRWYSSCKWP